MRLRSLAPLVVAVTAAASLAACNPFGGQEDSPTTGAVTAGKTGDAKGGTLHALTLGPALTWDPQRIGSRADMAFAGRTFIRTLTTYKAAPTVAGQSALVGDLATDTGTASADLKTWSFTLRPDVTWQDGTTVTCDDVKYGISRTFATGSITGGPTYAIGLLDLPRSTTGLPVYRGPYAADAAAAAGVAAYDKAVTCSDRTITFHLAAATADFNEVVTLPAFAPYPKAKDLKGDGTYAIWSTGPYMLKEAWQPSVGGVFVRNPAWKASSDPVRKARPNEIRYEEGLETPEVIQRLLSSASDGSQAVSLDSAPPALQQQIMASADLSKRALNPISGLVDYLAPNVTSPVFAKPDARRALAVATNRDAYATALGGATTATPTYSLIPSGLAAHTGEDVLGGGQTGDPAAAAALLTKAGLKPPVAITVAYRSTDSSDKAMAALVAGWRKAGFAPTLRPITEDYFSAIAAPSMKKVDLFWANWAPEWASASTIIPPLFNDSLNLSAAGSGRDYGYVADTDLNRKMDEIQKIADRADREKAWSELDRGLVQNATYIAVVQRSSMFLAGSSVLNFAANEALGGYVDLANIAVS